MTARKSRQWCRPTKLPLGTISEGTLKPDDLVRAYVSALNSIRITKKQRAAVGEAEHAHLDDDEAAGYILEDLDAIAQDYVPPYCYIGAHQGDGALIGVWPDWDAIADAEHCGDVIRSNKCPDARDKSGADHWLFVNDHGNATMYRRLGGMGARWRVVWTCV